MDEAIGGSCPRARGPKVTELLGVILAAKRGGRVPRVRPFLERLLKSDFSLSEEFVLTIIEEDGEA